MSAIAVHEIDPHDDSALRRWYDTFRAGVTAGRTAPLVESYDAFRTSLTQPSHRRTRLAVGAHDGENLCGALLFEFGHDEDTDVVGTEIGVPDSERGRGVGSALWAWAEQRMDELGRHIAQVELNVPAGLTLETAPGGRFALARGFVSGNVEDHLGMRWPATPPVYAHEPTYDVITWSGAAPEEHLQAYADMQSAMSADVPTGELTREQRTYTPERVREQEERLARSYRTHVAFARHRDGSPAGYSLLFADKADPADAIQDDTLVLQEHRGHGLGARLKAVNYEAARTVEPGIRWVHTWTAQQNGPMQHINAAFGFEVLEVMHEMELGRG